MAFIYILNIHIYIILRTKTGLFIAIPSSFIKRIRKNQNVRTRHRGAQAGINIM